MMIVRNSRRAAKIVAVALFIWALVYVFQWRQDHNPSHQLVIQYSCTVPWECGGWADRLKGIMSTYALSLLLNRTFSIQITQPCPLEKILLPNRINWNSVKNSPWLKYEFHTGHDYRYLDHIKTANFYRYLNSFHKHPFIEYKTGMMLTVGLSKTPSLEARIAELGYPDQNLFQINHQMHRWYNDLFKLAPSQQAKYEQLLASAKPNSKTFLICTQIRVGGATGKNNKDMKLADPNSEHDYFKFINRTFISNMTKFTDNPENYRVFVTTDVNHFKQLADNYFGRQKVVYNPEVAIHIDRDVANLAECSAIDNVIVDFHLFQDCDAMVVSHSGYGVLGAWNRREPLKHFYVYTKANQDDLRREYFDRKNMTFIQIRNLDTDLYFL